MKQTNSKAHGDPRSFARQPIGVAQDSSPGFTVRDVKLTREVFFKQVYIFVGLVSGLISVLSRLYM